MPDLTFLFNNDIFLDSPNGLLGWVCMVGMFGLVVFLLYRWKSYNQRWNRNRWITFGVLIALVPLTSLILPGLRLPASGSSPLPLVPSEPAGPVIMIFSSLPWILASGLLGFTPAAGLAAMSGLFMAYWGTHNPFLPLEMALLATLFSAFVNQRYRTLDFRILRHPLTAALLVGLIYPLLFILSSSLSSQGTLANRLDYAITHVAAATIAVYGSIVVGGLFTEVIYLVMPDAWASKAPLQPSPTERSIEARFIYAIAPFAFALVVVLMRENWVVAEKAANNMLKGRMANAAEMSTNSVPFLLETGQNLIIQYADDERLYTLNSEDIGQLLANRLRDVPYFRQLILLGGEGELVAGYPVSDSNELELSFEERTGVNLTLNGVLIQSYTVPPIEGSTTAQISFLAGVRNRSDQVKGILIGRSDLSSNPFAQPLLSSLKSLEEIDGEGILLDENRRMVYHSNPDRVMETYTGHIDEVEPFFDGMAPDGTRQLVYYQPVFGRPWSVIMAVPAQYVQQQALGIAAPLLLIIILLFILAVLLIHFGLRKVTGSLQTLTIEANRMSLGQLEQPLQVKGEDEAGQLSRAFEKMRANLKARLDELNRLLVVSWGVASSLEIEDSLNPVLEAALATGASSARVILAPEVILELDKDTSSPTSYRSGSAGDLYRNLDDQILALARKQDRILLTNLTRPRLLELSPGFPRPHALLAVALRHESLFYGTLWVSYDQPHHFTDEEVRFTVTLAGQAALAAANAHLFQTAEIGRKRLAAILASTPDPVLVTDYQNNLLLANPAAWQVFGVNAETGKGRPIDQVLSHEVLVNFLISSEDKQKSAELVLPEGFVYLATSSFVVVDGKHLGKVCVFRDVTNFKKLDALKSEFVSTVSHDLRSPLTLIRGYSTMLQMVGKLNEQQNDYVRKIISSVESMSRLVNNLLDLGRIEAGVGLQLEMISVQDIIERVIGALQMQATQKRIYLSTDIPDLPIPLVEADQALLQQALHNLVDNAIKYTNGEGKVQIGLKVLEGWLVFVVKDTGIGIAPADQQRLFEKFFRATKQDADRERGTGLGLAIVKSIAERHGGRVWLKSQLGQGSTFFLEIPQNQPKQEQRVVV